MTDSTLFPPGASSSLTPYRARHFRFAGVIDCGPLRVKLTTIRTAPEPVSPSVLDVATACLQEQLPRHVEEEGDHHGLGFAVLHEGQDALWLLMDWWAHAEICCQVLVHAPVGPAPVFETSTRPFQACVWEHVVVAHEHRAWVETMLTEKPDPAAYLADVLPVGEH
ncbi:MAG: hypothetical protein AAF533_01225 [Acidobacteriota bacterium]